MSESAAKSGFQLQEFLLFRRLWPYMKKDAWVFVLALFATPLITALSLAQPYLIKNIIDDHISIGNVEQVPSLALLYLGLVLISYLLSGVYTFGMSWAGQRMLVRLRTGLYRRVLRLPQSFFDRRPAGVILTRLTSDVEAIGESIGAGVVTIAIDVLMITGCLVMMLQLDWELTALLALLSPVLITILELVRRQMRKLYIKIRESIAEVNAYLAEHIDGVEILQLYSSEQRSRDEFERLNSDYRSSCHRSNVLDSFIFALVDGAGSIFIAMVLLGGIGQLQQLGLFSEDVRSARVAIAFIEYLNRLLTRYEICPQRCR